MTSQGQRFRRRALRRGYKVDEVDTFLDRVEATLAGEQVGAPVGAQEVHDVVFRVRFGGYDEWQVDLHLDRVERQLAELEERGGRPADPRMSPNRMGADRGMDRMGADRGMDRMGADRGMDRGMDRMGADRGADRMGPPDRMGAPMGQERMNRAAPPTERLPAPIRDDRGMSPPMAPRPITSMPASGAPDPYGRYDDPGYGQPPQQPPSPYDAGGYDTGSYDAFEPGRHGKADMTAEIRMPERDNRGYGPPPAAPPMGGPPMGGPPMGGPPMGGPPTGGPSFGPPAGGGPGGGDLHRVDQLRRTFQPRRFGSGYDPMQVDRLFEEILMAMSGRGPMPVNENELDMLQFGLVPGGYFEAEVDAALREVKDILRRR